MMSSQLITSQVLVNCDVIQHKQNAVAYQQMIFKSFEHSQAYSADVTVQEE